MADCPVVFIYLLFLTGCIKDSSTNLVAERLSTSENNKLATLNINTNDLTLTLASEEIELNRDYHLYADFSDVLWQHIDEAEIFYYICKSGTNFQNAYTVNSLNNIPIPGVIKLPGKWDIQARVYEDWPPFRVYKSNIVTLKVLYPEVSFIKDNPTVQAYISTLWNQTKSAASYAGRREKGAWIYGKTHTNDLSFEYTFTPVGDGPITFCGQVASINFGSTSETPQSTSSPYQGANFVVATVHTHTPLTYCTPYNAGPRYTGPSTVGGDNYADVVKIPFLIQDYSDPQISPGHNINMVDQTYTIGPVRRQIP